MIREMCWQAMTHYYVLICFDVTGTDEDTQCLIKWRAEREGLFTGKRNAAIKGFEYVQVLIKLISSNK